MSRPMKMPKTLGEVQRRFPDAHIELVGNRKEIVVYTGLTPDYTKAEAGDRSLRPLTTEEIVAGTIEEIVAG